jgi:hypothetical protein
VIAELLRSARNDGCSIHPVAARRRATLKKIAASKVSEPITA